LLFSFNTVLAKDIIINEIAWMGTVSSANDEWIELYNTSNTDISLENYKLFIGDKEIRLKGLVRANSFYILERTDDTTLPQVKADLIYTGSIKNTGAKLSLKDNQNNLIDEANFEKGWTAGNNETKQTAERIENTWQTSANKEGSPYALNIAFNQNIREEIKPTSDQTKEKQEEKYSSIQEIQKENNNFPLKIMLGISFISGTVIVFIRKQLKA